MNPIRNVKIQIFPRRKPNLRNNKPLAGPEARQKALARMENPAESAR
jgi:hypothetical protein